MAYGARGAPRPRLLLYIPHACHVYELAAPGGGVTMSMEEGLQSAQAAVKEVKEEGEGEVKSEERQGEEEDDGACSDQELDELLNC